MKQIFIILFTLLSIVGTLEAQKKKVSATGGKYAVLQVPFDIDATTEDATNIYLLETRFGSNNAVYALNKATGNISVFIDGIEGIFEDPRPIITYIKATNDGRFFFVMGSNFYEYNGKDVETSKKIKEGLRPGWDYPLSTDPKEKYLLLGQGEGFLYTLPDLKLVNSIKSNGNNSLITDGKGNIWSRSYDKIQKFELGSQTPITYEMGEGNTISESFSCDLKILPDSNKLILATGRRLYYTPLDSATNWKQLARMNKTHGGKYQIIIPNKNGNFTTVMNEIPTKFLAAYSWTDISNPEFTEKLITDIKNPAYSYSPEMLKTNSAKDGYFDKSGNLILQNDRDIYIYNPKGIIGYTNLKGKFKKYQPK